MILVVQLVASTLQQVPLQCLSCAAVRGVCQAQRVLFAGHDCCTRQAARPPVRCVCELDRPQLAAISKDRPRLDTPAVFAAVATPIEVPSSQWIKAIRPSRDEGPEIPLRILFCTWLI
jgi:hypothetical protein